MARVGSLTKWFQVGGIENNKAGLVPAFFITMTKLVNGVLIIQDTPDETCEQCGKESELRPYGPGGMKICFDCAMKDEKGTNERFSNILRHCSIEAPTMH
ncbi:hypothetical protein D3C87_278510 [compost metagenome]